jgi:hypothetical protein
MPNPTVAEFLNRRNACQGLFIDVALFNSQAVEPME